MLATEFLWRKPPSNEAREVFLGQACPGLQFDTLDDWVKIYGNAGLCDIKTETGPFEMMRSRMVNAVPYLGYVLVAGRKPA